jgi:hypothetical protein
MTKMSEAKKKTTKKKAVKKPRINKAETVATPIKKQVKVTEAPVIEAVKEASVTFTCFLIGVATVSALLILGFLISFFCCCFFLCF